MEKKRKVDDITQGNNKDFVEDGMTTEDIRKNVRYIREYLSTNSSSSHSDRVEQLKMTCKTFNERYPVLFEMCLKRDFDMKQLNYFLEKRDQIINDKASSEELSMQIGKEMFDKYVDVSKLSEKKP